MQVSALQRRVLDLEASERQSQELLQDKEAYHQQCDQKHSGATAQLEEALDDAGIQIKQLAEQVGLAESKVQGLQERLGASDAQRRDLELKLAGLYSALCRAAGTHQARLSGSPASRKRSPSPRKNCLQVKGIVMAVHNNMWQMFAYVWLEKVCSLVRGRQ